MKQEFIRAEQRSFIEQQKQLAMARKEEEYRILKAKELERQIRKAPKVKLKLSERLALKKETLEGDSYYDKLKMIMKANRIPDYQLDKNFPGIDDTLEFKQGLSTLYNNTRDRRDKIIIKLHYKSPLLVNSLSLQPSFRRTQRDQHIALEMKKYKHAAAVGTYDPQYNLRETALRNQEFLKTDRF
jgi:hypothetical protein